MSKRVLIIIPAYNEEATLEGVIRDVRDHQPRADIVVVDDGSSDNTSGKALSLGAPLLRLPINLGIGGAVQTGFRYARRQGYDFALQVDGDGQHPAGQIADLLQPVRAGEADVVIGSRFLEDRGYHGGLARRLGVWVFQILNRVVSRRRFSDSTSGFRAYNRRAIEFLADSYPSDYPEVESIVTLIRNRFRVTEIPVTMRERHGGRSSITFPRAIYYMVKVTLASLVSNLKPRRPEG